MVAMKTKMNDNNYYYQLMIMITVLNLTYVTEVTCLIIQ